MGGKGRAGNGHRAKDRRQKFRIHPFGGEQRRHVKGNTRRGACAILLAGSTAPVYALLVVINGGSAEKDRLVIGINSSHPRNRIIDINGRILSKRAAVFTLNLRPRA
jgi:hypothetical protein